MKFKWVALVFALMTIGLAVAWWPRASHGDVLNASAAPAVLTTSELASVPDQQVLERVQLECQRRMVAAGLDSDWSLGVDTLPIKAGTIYVIAKFEADTALMTLSQRLRVDSVLENSKIGPTCTQAAAAYDRLGMKDVAALLREATAIPGPWSDDDQRLMALHGRYRRLVGTGSEAKLIAYARSNRASLLD